MIRQTLQDLPVGLVQTYERILLKISKSPLRKQEIALRVFRWTLCSQRPMKAEELQEAVAFESCDTFWDRDKIPDEDLMIETCRGLLVRDEEDRTVRFAHHTVQQYLLSAPVTGTQEGSCFSVSPRSKAEAFVGGICVTYLCFSDFETQIALRTPDVQLEERGVLKFGGPVMIPTVLGIGNSLLGLSYRLLRGKSPTESLNIDYSKYLTSDTWKRPQVSSGLKEKYRLLDYIVEYWMDHTKELEPAIDAKFRQLVKHKKLSFEFRPWGSNQHLGPYGCISCPQRTSYKELPFMSLFHYAAQAGHWNLMESLVTEYCQHEVPFDETLLIACRHGQDLIVQNLMQRIKFDISDGRAVNVAAAAGHTGVLTHFMDFSLKNAENGKKFLSYDFNANAASLLHLAATNGHEKVIDCIFIHCRSSSSEVVEDSVYINQKDELSGRTPFFTAVMSGQENIVRNFLARGAQIKAHGTTAVHTAAEHGHEEILRILLEVAIKVYTNNTGELAHMYPRTLLLSRDTRGETPLHKAAGNGHSAVVALIIWYLSRFGYSTSRDEDTDALESTCLRSAEKCSASHLAAKGGHLDVLKLLIDNGVSIEAKTEGEGWTVLHLAAAEGHEAVVQWLLQNHARHSVPTKDGTKAVHLAVRGGHDVVVRAFFGSVLKQEEACPYSGEFVPFGEMLAMFETAAEYGRTSVLRALYECSGSLGTLTGAEYLKAAFLVAQRERQNDAADLIFSLLDPSARFTCFV